MSSSGPEPSSPWHLGVGTFSFMLCFAGWGLMSAFGPVVKTSLGLTATEAAMLVTAPVLLGALARLPMGILADRFGGRVVFSVLMVAVALPVYLVPSAHSLSALLVLGLLLGLAGSSFSVGVSYVSGWVPKARQGAALGIFGLGTMGQALVIFGAPMLARRVGWPAVFHSVALALLRWGIGFALLARDAPSAAARPRNLRQALGLLRRERLVWVLSLFYFLTFGGFVALSVYLPTLLRADFGLAASDAGLRAAIFVLLSTLCRPLGGALADRIGGARVLAGVFTGVVPFGLLLAWPEIEPFTAGALGCAVLLGVGNGAVFRLVPEYFPRDTGTATGLIGAMGGLGGFFPPLLVGLSRDRLGVIWPAVILLSALALGLAILNHRLFYRRQQSLEHTLGPAWLRTSQRLRAGAWATVCTGLLCAAIVIGSRNLQNFDSALVIYTFAVIFATWGVVYHYSVWMQKPPTRLLWQRGLEIVRQRGVVPSLLRAGRAAGTHLLAQTFIYRRSPMRWLAHQLIFWGCVLAVAITFPLVFGWIHFRTPPDQPHVYVTYLFGFPTGSFRLYTVLSWLLFHGLDVSALLVLGGVTLALARRLRERGAQALQSFARDMFPLVLLFAISLTGLALTVSSLWMRGASYEFLALLHAITVIVALLFLPFGKFFHIFQRPASLGVKLYQDAGRHGQAAACARCGAPFAAQMQIDDLRIVLGQLGFDYTVPGAPGHWQALCPPCKRKTVAAAQLGLKGQPR
ncbi:MAG: MFS transporter [Deltaproteobacteria bacterium]|nr:MFS transporter [Deltaproteobacteria bacterium]